MTEALRHQVGSLLIVGLEGTVLTSLELAWLRALQPAGIILFRRNIESAAQVHALFQQAASVLERPFFRCVDLEGGPVDRLRDLIGPTPSVAEVAATGDTKLFRAHGEWIGKALAALGFNADLAPVLDLALPASAKVMGARVAAKSPEAVTQYAKEFLAGLARHNVLGCGKHFPGLGGGTLDSHHATPRIGRTWEQMQADLAPYRALARTLPMVMVSHAAYPRIEKPARPASLSRFWIEDVLRKQLGFRGLVISDDMEMGGVLNAASMEGAVVEAIAAGTDLVEICHRPDRVLAAHEALLREAERSAKFRKRVAEASTHVRRAQRRWLHTPLPARAISAAGLRQLQKSQQRLCDAVEKASV
jgi:beta-N-acetylhexosaminidase